MSAGYGEGRMGGGFDAGRNEWRVGRQDEGQGCDTEREAQP